MSYIILYLVIGLLVAGIIQALIKANFGRFGTIKGFLLDIISWPFGLYVLYRVWKGK